jgi:hypothetical protein
MKQMFLEIAPQAIPCSIPGPLTMASHTTTVSNAPKPLTKSKKSAMDIFNESVGDGINGDHLDSGDANRKAAIIDDIRNYRAAVTKFNLKHKLNESSATTFWKTYGQNFPELGKLTRRLLCAPATSVPSESAFSVSAYLGRKERARLTEENLASSVFLKDKVIL